jgi:hypothetical protein
MSRDDVTPWPDTRCIVCGEVVVFSVNLAHREERLVRLCAPTRLGTVSPVRRRPPPDVPPRYRGAP